nr:DNA-binding WRKY [Tanacetum cinerariifolium]
MTYDVKTRIYSRQFDEQWFNLNVNLLQKALEITPVDPTHPFESPPDGKAIMDFVNQLGYSKLARKGQGKKAQKELFKLVDEEEEEGQQEPEPQGESDDPDEFGFITSTKSSTGQRSNYLATILLDSPESSQMNLCGQWGINFFLRFQTQTCRHFRPKRLTMGEYRVKPGPDRDRFSPKPRIEDRTKCVRSGPRRVRPDRPGPRTEHESSLTTNAVLPRTQGTSVKRSALWRDVKRRVITKASHTSAANNNTLAQGPTSPHGERVISFNNSSRKISFQHILPVAHAQNIDANRSVRIRHIFDLTSISAAEHCQSDSACDEGLSTCEPSFSNSAFNEGPATCQPSSSNAKHRQSNSALDEASSDPEALQTRLRSMIAPSESSEEVAVSRSNEIESEVISIPPDSTRQKKESAGVNDTVATKANYEPRIVVATTSPVDIVNDGYHWRKYGQKLVKGNPNPRSYYKCAYACCSVRKHVETASHDEKVVVTTYEGRLDHEMPSGIRTGMSLYFQPRNPKLVQVEGVNLPDEKIELEEKVDDLEHRSQEVPLDMSQTMNLEEVKCLSPTWKVSGSSNLPRRTLSFQQVERKVY